MNPDLIERKRRGFHAVMEHMPQLIEKIRYRIKPIDLRNCYSSLAHDHLTIGLFRYFVENDVGALKQNFHTACQLELAAMSLDGYQKFETAVEIFCALISDSPEMISAMARFESDYFIDARKNSSQFQFKVHMWQLAVQGDYPSLEAKLVKLAEGGRKADRLLASQRKDFFSLLIDGDKRGLEDLIRLHADKRDRNAFAGDYLSFIGTLEAKLCWYRGIPVEIDHPLVPMELMPIQPPSQYDNVYDFLQLEWVPPAQGIVGRLSRLFKQ